MSAATLNEPAARRNPADPFHGDARLDPTDPRPRDGASGSDPRTILIGQRVQLSPLRHEDTALLASWVSDPGFMGDYLPHCPVTEGRLRQRLDVMLDSGYGIYIVSDRLANVPVGVALHFYPFNPYQTAVFHGVEIAYQIDPRYRNRGYATQAVGGLVDHLFRTTRTQRIQATVVDGNAASFRVLEKAGLRLESICRDMAVLNGHHRDMRLYAVVRTDWERV